MPTAGGITSNACSPNGRRSAPPARRPLGISVTTQICGGADGIGRPGRTRYLKVGGPRRPLDPAKAVNRT
ncbi:hypothetical protein [Blastochloris viridis]|uniref:Uncharacterized protein n=1 Tax=Blastochloris viridis TaxID=1079 RepID=A0A0P0IT79_BLAVI|nr:hypothetical protein [Blastochloris viridis]ALK10351.1 hypothetical protein BVIR_2586 [Blastochloris viridis]CUU43013.1 hypothetical protein BVIRIDIS_20300 [Blastochloris viridis]